VARNTMKANDTHNYERSQRELADGVLKQAAQDLRRFHGAVSAIERELYLDAYRWVISDDFSWPFSFLNVCELLNLSPEDVRQELVSDLSLGAFSQWARRCRRAARQLQHLLIRVSQRRHNVRATEPVELIHTSH
jgi:hypothetical protein